MTHFYKATHTASGRVHLRKSERPYTWAAVTHHANGANWSSKRDLAQREVERQRRFYDDVELAKAEEITREEYTALDKGNKNKFVVTYRGKKFTTTTDKAHGDPVGAVGYYRPAHQVARPFAMTDADYERRVAELEEMVARGHGGQKSLDDIKAAKASGFWSPDQYREDFAVRWRYTAADVESTAKSYRESGIAYGHPAYEVEILAVTKA